MNFHRYLVYRDYVRRLPEYMAGNQKFVSAEKPFLDHWVSASRPYYRIYPGIESFLLNAELKLTGLQFFNSVLIPLYREMGSAVLSLEFSEKSQVVQAGVLIGTIFCRPTKTLHLTFMYSIDSAWLSSTMTLNDQPIQEQWKLLESHYEEELLQFADADQHRNEMILRVFVGACMLAKDPDLVEKILLNRDAQKNPTATPENQKTMEDRAGRLNGRGWSIGRSFEKQLEISPHFRNSCLQTYWTGKGRTVPRLQFRQGGIVKRKKATEVPTGYYGERQCEGEP
jgi:hypothetical protein